MARILDHAKRSHPGAFHILLGMSLSCMISHIFSSVDCKMVFASARLNLSEICDLSSMLIRFGVSQIKFPEVRIVSTIK